MIFVSIAIPRVAGPPPATAAYDFVFSYSSAITLRTTLMISLILTPFLFVVAPFDASNASDASPTIAFLIFSYSASYSLFFSGFTKAIAYISRFYLLTFNIVISPLFSTFLVAFVATLATRRLVVGGGPWVASTTSISSSPRIVSRPVAEWFPRAIRCADFAPDVGFYFNVVTRSESG